VTNDGRPALLRALGLLGLTAIAVNGVVGSGIFFLPATAAKLLGPAAPVAYLVAALLTGLVVACFAEAGSAFDRTGGPYLYAREAFGPFVGFQVGWLFFLTRLTAAAAIGNAYLDSLAYFWPAVGAGAGRAVTLALTLASLAALNLRGVRQGAWAVDLLTVAKLLPLVLFVAAGLAVADPSRYTLVALPDSTALRQGALHLIFAFGGFENASVPGEESKDPRRHLPVALLSAIALTAVLYVLIQVVAQGTLPNLAEEATPLAASARTFLGPQGATLMTLAALLSTAGSLSALALVGPRILYAFGEGGQMPAALARVHPRFRTPATAIVAFTVAAWGASLVAGFTELVAVSATARLAFSAATCLAVPVLRRRTQGSRRFTVPGGPAVPLAATALSVWLLTSLNRTQAVAGAVALAVGVLLYLGAGRRPPTATPPG
jgi:amino acid transporter